MRLIDQMWRTDLLDYLAAHPACGYYADQSPATEPTALTALALLAADRIAPAAEAASWLRTQQHQEGSLSVRQDAEFPRWPTSLAALTWQGLLAHRDDPDDKAALQRAVEWILNAEGQAIQRPEGEQEWPYGHNTMLIAWPWVLGTHSWIEPTCLHVLALRATGHNAHARTREAVKLLYDRQLPDGGCNYGNTLVLGQMLRPHVQPSGMLATTLAAEPDSSERLKPTLEYLKRQAPNITSAASLSWTVLGLKANGQSGEFEAQLHASYEREQKREPASPYRLALLALAASENSGLLAEQSEPSE